MKISTKQVEVFGFSRKPRWCTLQVSGNKLQQFEKFKCLGVAFTSGERRNKEIDTDW